MKIPRTAPDNKSVGDFEVLVPQGRHVAPMRAKRHSWIGRGATKGIEGKERERESISAYIPFIVRIVSKRSDMDHCFTCKLHHACLSFVSVHQMAPPLTQIADIQLQLITHLSIPNR